jgi:hypothetical protein
MFIGLSVGRKTIMDAMYLGIGAVFFAAAWGLVWALGRLQKGKQP